MSLMCGYVCVWICTCEHGGLAISLADSGHLAKGFGDRHCLLSTITLIFTPCLRCPCHSLGSPFTPKETLWNGWETTDAMPGMDGTKERVQGRSKKKKKNPCCQLAKPSRHISSSYWARIQINILLLTNLVGLMYAAVLSSGWSGSPEVWASTETLVVMGWSSSSWLGECVGSLAVAHHTFSCLTHVLFLTDESKGL